MFSAVNFFPLSTVFRINSGKLKTETATELIQKMLILFEILQKLLFLPFKNYTMTFQNTREFAKQLDSQDTLNHYQDQFIFPKVNDKRVIYFTGNSLVYSQNVPKLISMK